MAVRVFVVGTDEAYRARLARRMARAPEVEVLAEARPGISVFAQAQALLPDVVVLHADPQLDGQLDACGPLTSVDPAPLLLVLGRLGQLETERAIEAGADAVVSPTLGSRSFARLLRLLAERRDANGSSEALAGGPSSESEDPYGVTRRSFLRGAAAGAVGAAAVTVGGARPALAGPKTIAPRTDLDLPTDKESILVRMQQDLQRALKKPLEERRWAMVIDLRKCIGCSACTVACVAENHLPPGVVYRPVTEEEVGTYPNVARKFLPRPCMQCDAPPCVDVCPVAATHKRPDGVVEVDYEKCIGCRYCIAACPYGARTFDWGDNWTDGTPSAQGYESAPAPEYGQEWPRKGTASPIGNVRKCTFCLHRLNAGMLPSCTTTCVGGATYFGDASDAKSLVSELIGSENAELLKPELGTKPRVYYLR